MEELLARVTQQAMNYAIRSGITITASYAFSQSARLLSRAKNSQEKQEFQRLQERLESRVRIVSPAIDMIELISARGNTSLETTANLTKSLRRDILALGRDTADEASALDGEEESAKSSMRRLIPRTRELLARIEDAVPLISLAITTSGVNLSTSLPAGVSPSRLLQASTFLTAGDTQYIQQHGQGAVQIGPTFTLSLYMLFVGHVRPQDEEQVRRTTWKETIHKARIKLMRVPLDSLDALPSSGAEKGAVRPDEFAYQMLLIEDLDDGRMHEDNEEKQSDAYEGVANAGIREALPVHQISRIFYADTGKILNIGGDGEANNPILLLKRDIRAVPPRRMLELTGVEDEEHHAEEETDEDPDQSAIDAQLHHESRQSSVAPEPKSEKPPVRHRGIPRDVDPEWLAFEVYTEDTDTSTESEASDVESPPPPYPEDTAGGGLDKVLSELQLKSPAPGSRSRASKIPSTSKSPRTPPRSPPTPSLPAIRTSLSLLEMMLRLLSLQQFQQQPHLSIPDEFLSFFLSDAAATTGAAAGDEATRRRIRAAAVGHLGFDPYDESPIRRLGEAGIESRNGVSDEAWDSGGAWGIEERMPASISSYGRRTSGEYATSRFSASPSPLTRKVKRRTSKSASPGVQNSDRGSVETPAREKANRGTPLVNSETIESIEK